MCFPVASTSSAIRTTILPAHMMITEPAPTERPTTAATQTTTSQTTASTIQITSPGKSWTYSERNLNETGVMIILTA